MALSYYEVDKNQINNIIESEEFSIFKREMEEKLNIQDIQYEIEVQDIAYDDGYVESYTNARTRFKNGYTKIDKVIFFTENIKEEINRKFLRLSTNSLAFDKVIDTYVKAMFLHELVHIQQFKSNRLNQEVIIKEQKLPYKSRPLEIEANNISKQIIGEFGKFELEIAIYIYSNLSVHNGNVSEIFELFSDLTGSDNYDK